MTTLGHSPVHDAPDIILDVRRTFGIDLEPHLRNVIENIEQRSPVELMAIGVGYDVSRSYRRAVTLVDARQLGSAMLEKLAELLHADAASAPGELRRRRGTRTTAQLAAYSDHSEWPSSQSSKLAGCPPMHPPISSSPSRQHRFPRSTQRPFRLATRAISAGWTN